jgi:hypothetical protein
MKTILAILALACVAYAMPERFKRDMPNFEAIKNSCPGKCLNEDKYRQTFSRLAPTGREVAKKFKASKKPTNIVPDLQAQQMEEACQEVGKVQTCISACNDPKDAQIKQKALAILNAVKDLTCDAEIKTHLTCLSKLDDEAPSTAPPECQQCEPLLEPLSTAAHETIEANGTNLNWEKAKTMATAVCKFTNCALKCVKVPVEQKCQAAGYSALKTLIKKTANLAQVTHAQFRPPQNFPNECKPDVIVAGVSRL